MNKNFFPEIEDVDPKIYAYSDKRYENCLKIGYTVKNVEDRVKEQYPIVLPDKDIPYVIEYKCNAIKNNGDLFDDHLVHKVLRDKGFKSRGGEWFEIDVKKLESVVNQIKNDKFTEENRTLNYKLRPEQSEAIERTSSYFKDCKTKENRVPHFLWNAKMRFGKTFTSYKLVEKMGWKNVPKMAAVLLQKLQ